MLLLRIIFMPLTYTDWSPTLSSVPHGTRVIAAISASNLVSRPCTRVINASVISPENSSSTVDMSTPAAN
uniref:Uncharacterized protein n=1 Tax=Rhizophora mucronata TaxID=61149 RepID=A0A2P2LZG1_RHIMU